MECFYVLKPDLTINKNEMKYFLNILNNTSFIKDIKFQELTYWPEICKELYDPNELLYDSIDDLKDIRRKILTTIKTYQILYKNENAYLLTYQTDNNKLEKLQDIKFDFRKKYVKGTDRYYLKFNDEIDLNNHLMNIDLDIIDFDFKKLDFPHKLDDKSYNLANLNKVHMADPIIEEVEKDLRILKTYCKK